MALYAPLSIVTPAAWCQDPAAPEPRDADADADRDDTLQPVETTHRYLAWFEDMRVRRERHVRRLAEYRDAGQFPKNTYMPGLTPVFIDKDGTACAVGWLMLRDGQQELVDHVVKADNFIRLENLDVTSELGREVLAWLTANGLTLAEAARIQPSYDWPEPGPQPQPEPQPQPQPIEPQPQPAPVQQAVEIVRLKKHFRAVIGELESAAVASLVAITQQRVAAEPAERRSGAGFQLATRTGAPIKNDGDGALQVWLQPIDDAGQPTATELWTMRLRAGSTLQLPDGVDRALVVTQPVEG